MRNRIETIVLVTLMTVSAGNLLAGGLAVSPATFSWYGVTPGTVSTLAVPIRVTNRGRDVASYTLRVVSPESIGAESSPGYDFLPAAGWVSFDRRHIVVNPGESVEVRVSLRVPANTRFTNRKWQFFVEVKEHDGLGKMFALACYPKFLVTTRGEILSDSPETDRKSVETTGDPKTGPPEKGSEMRI
jgi:hypothetical protein